MLASYVQTMAIFGQFFLRFTMVFVLSLGLVIPSSAFVFSAGKGDCPSCLEKAFGHSEDTRNCCAFEESGAPADPCNHQDCQCPDCPFCMAPAGSLNGVLSPQMPSVISLGHSLFFPVSGLEFQSFEDAPVPPPPRLG